MTAGPEGYTVFEAPAGSGQTGDSFVSMVACGDFGPVRNLENRVLQDRSPDILGEMKGVLENADLVFANLESVFSERGTPLHKTPVFRLNPGAFDIVRQAGVNVASLANNHMADYGREAFADTLELLSGNRIGYFGAGLSANEASSPLVVAHKQITFGFIGFCEKQPHPDNGVFVQQTDPGRIIQGIREIRDRVDWVVVSLHMGLEYRFHPSPADVRLCRNLIDQGADIVLCHHPHYPQGYEVYKGGFISYSLGNFVWDQHFTGSTHKSYAVKLMFTRRKLCSVRVVPYCMDSDYRIRLLKSNGFHAFLKQISADIRDARALDRQYYYITRDHFQTSCRELGRHLPSVRAFAGGVKALLSSPRDRYTLLQFLKYVMACRAFAYELHLFRKKRLPLLPGGLRRNQKP